MNTTGTKNVPIKPRPIEACIDDFIEHRDDGIYMTHEGFYKASKAFREKMGLSIGRKVVTIFDPDEPMKEFSAGWARARKEDVQSVIDAGDDPIECPDCGNREDFSVFVSQFYVRLKDGKEIESVHVENEESIAKPDTIVFICNKCDKVACESML